MTEAAAESATVPFRIAGTWLRVNGLKSSSQRCGHVEQVAVVAVLFLLFVGKVAMKPAKLVILDKNERVSWNHVAAAPSSRLPFWSSAVFEPHIIHCPGLTFGERKREILKGDVNRATNGYDPSVEALRHCRQFTERCFDRLIR